MYLQEIEPGLTYGCHIWSNALKYIYFTKRLNQFQRPFAIKAAKGFNTMSLTSSLVLANFIPIDLRIQELVRIENVKLTSISEHLPSDKRYQSRVEFWSLDHPAERIRVNALKAGTPESVESLARETEISVYTDGSK
jgi:hypothetical protein